MRDIYHNRIGVARDRSAVASIQVWFEEDHVNFSSFIFAITSTIWPA